MSAEELARLVWIWIINHHTLGYDGDDLIAVMEQHGFICPPDLED